MILSIKTAQGAIHRSSILQADILRLLGKAVIRVHIARLCVILWPICPILIDVMRLSIIWLRIAGARIDIVLHIFGLVSRIRIDVEGTLKLRLAHTATRKRDLSAAGEHYLCVGNAVLLDQCE